MNRVFLDTVGFIALWNARDQWHSDAAKVFARLTSRGVDFCTTTYIMLECGNAASRTPFRGDVVEVREQFLADGKLIDPSPADCEMAWADYAKGSLGGAGIVDHVSFAVMRRLGITDAFSNDRHFKIAGFNTLF
jgi:predicted nucleic acid-binding protein